MQSAVVNKGVVTFADGQLYNSKYGTRKRCKISVKCNGQEVHIWGYEDSPITHYQQGDAIEFIQNGNEYIFINPPQKRERHADTQPTPSASPTTMTAPIFESKKWEEPPKDIKKDIVHYTEFQTKVYLQIFKEVSDKFSDMGLKDELIKDISTTLFIQTNRKFNI